MKSTGDKELSEEKRLKFSAFARRERDYVVPNQAQKKMKLVDEEFVPKQEFSRIQFDQNVRHRMDDMDNKLIYRALRYKEPDLEPRSMYCAVEHEGKIWHLFNAERMPLGRIAALAAGFLRGKNKPNHCARRDGEHGDFVVIVNAANQHVTGRKLDLKKYYKYTGYVGNLQETTLRLMLERNPEEVLYRAIKGMIPKTKLREDILRKRLFLYTGPFHPHHSKGLPQFMEREPIDINEEFNFGKMVERRHEYKIIYESDPSNPAEEFADVERDIDPSIEIPDILEKKTHTNPK